MDGTKTIMAGPDFDQIALMLVTESTALRLGTQSTARVQVAIIEQLRRVWNDRGAADLEAYQAVGNSSPYDIARALRMLDR